MDPSNLAEERVSTSSESAAAAPRDVPGYVTKLNPDDVMLGRGSPVINYPGNVRFRELVSKRKAEYNSTSRHNSKDEIARQIVEEIAKRNGRFLRKVESLAKVQQLDHLPEGAKAWQVAEEGIAIEKVKQALRDKDPVKPSSCAEADPAMRSPVNHATVEALESSRRSYSVPDSSKISVHSAASLNWLGAANSLHHHLREVMQKPKYSVQQLEQLNQQRLKDEFEAIFRQQQQQQQQQFRPLSRLALLRSRSDKLTTEELLTLHRREAAMAAANMQADQSFTTLCRPTDQARPPEAIHHAALAVLREQQRMDLNAEIMMRNHNTFPASRSPQFGLNGGGSPSAHHGQDSLILSLLRQQKAASLSSARFHYSNAASTPFSAMARSPLMSLADIVPAAVQQPSSICDLVHKRKASEDLSAVTSSTSSATKRLRPL